MIPHSKWIAHCPTEIKCSNHTCTNVIKVGDICVKHPGGPGGILYGCKSCGTDPNISTVWAGPLVSELVVIEDDWTWKVEDMGVSLQCSVCHTDLPEGIIAKHYYSGSYEDEGPTYNGWSVCNKCCGGHLFDGSSTEMVVKPTKIYKVTSFGIKNGKPETYPKKKIMDLRKVIRNPYKVPKFRKLTGLDPSVQDFVRNCLNSKGIVSKAAKVALVYGEVYLGCHAGKHRSVAIAEMVAENLRSRNLNVEVIHREL